MRSWKRFIRPGVTVSVAGHLAFLALGLHLVGAQTHQAIPPDAMVVDIVPTDEAPRYSGTPSDLRSNGSQTELKSNAPSLVAQSPPPKPPPSSTQKQKPVKQKPDASPAEAQTQLKLADAAQAEATSAETKKPDEAPPPAPQESPEQTQQDKQGVADALAQMALVGGELGGGFMAPPVNTNQAGYDFTLAFRERVSACATLPAGVGPTDKVSAGVRIFLNRDGTLAGPPQASRPIGSPKERALLQAAIEALEKCQPYTMLPADKYKVWKVLDLDVFPLNFGG